MPIDDTQSLSSPASHRQRPTCPPDNERVPAWRASNQSSQAEDDAVDDNTAAGMALSQEQSIYAIGSEIPVSDEQSSTQVPAKTTAMEEQDTLVHLMSPESIIADIKENEVPMSPMPAASSAATSSTSSYNYEFSNVRVSLVIRISPVVQEADLDAYTSSFLITTPLSCDLAQNLPAPNNPIGKCTTSMSRSSMLIWLSPRSADTFGYKV